MKNLFKLLILLLLICIIPAGTANAAVKLNVKNKELEVGQTVTLKVTGTKKVVKWSSSNKQVATVTKKGKVTAKQAGTATITAKVGKKKYKCKVTVTELLMENENESGEQSEENNTVSKEDSADNDQLKNEESENSTEENKEEQTKEDLPKGELPNSEDLLRELKEINSNLSDIQAFTADNDPNGSLGRPNQYVSKADFSDFRVEQIGEYLCGGTIETFLTKEDCQARADYLRLMSDPSLGAFGVNQYIYQYDRVLFRVDYDLTPEQAEEYHKQMTDIVSKYE